MNSDHVQASTHLSDTTAWSPDSRWITAGVDGGIGVVSPDGAQKRVLFKRPFQRWSSLGWSRDGTTLFLLEGGREDPVRLSAADVSKGAERLIHEYPPDGNTYSELYVSAGRLYPSRDGKYLLGSRFSVRSSIWLLEGVEPPRSFLASVVQSGDWELGCGRTTTLSAAASPASAAG
jgi:hypothetical protein